MTYSVVTQETKSVRYVNPWQQRDLTPWLPNIVARDTPLQVTRPTLPPLLHFHMNLRLSAHIAYMQNVSQMKMVVTIFIWVISVLILWYEESQIFIYLYIYLFSIYLFL